MNMLSPPAQCNVWMRMENLLTSYGSKLSYRLFILVLVRNLAQNYICCDFHLVAWSFIVI